jgi:hypothetical protein
MGKMFLVVVVYVLGAVAIVTGLLAVIFGPAAQLGGAPGVPSSDSQFRYANMVWLCAGLVLVWSARKPSERALVTRTVLLIAAAGGIGRLISIFATGLPHPFYLVTMVLELVLTPLIVLWHSRVFPVTRAVASTK